MAKTILLISVLLFISMGFLSSLLGVERELAEERKREEQKRSFDEFWHSLLTNQENDS